VVEPHAKAYLLGLITGKGSLYRSSRRVAIEFAHSNKLIDGIAHCTSCGYLATKPASPSDLRCKNPDCGKQVSGDVKTTYEQQEATKFSIAERIVPYITDNSKLISKTIGNDSTTILVLDFQKEPDWFDEISGSFPQSTSFLEFRIPGTAWDYDQPTSVSFFNGVMDATGYANAGSWIPRGGTKGYGRMRLYVQIVRNWFLASDVDGYLRNKLNCPVQTIDWGHPNIRDSKLQDFRAARPASWAREHQVKFFPEYLSGMSFRLAHKQALFQELLKHNLECGFSDDSGWFPPPVIRENSRKPRHPGENDPRLPREVRQHFDAAWQISLALGSFDVTQLAKQAIDAQVFALTGDLLSREDPGLLRRRLEITWNELADKLPHVRVKPKANKQPLETHELEKATYEPLMQILGNELRRHYACEPLVFDTSTENLNNFLGKLSGNQVREFEGYESLSIRPDVIGFIPTESAPFIIESKIELLTVRHLGQLLGYCAVANPIRAILVSTHPVSDSLRRALLANPTVVDYAPGRRIEIARLQDGQLQYWDGLDVQHS